MTEHSILPPSSAARRVACPGSRAMEAQYPQDESPQAKEGEAAHWVATENANFHKFPPIGTIAPNGEAVTKEMVDGAELYAESIRSVISRIVLPPTHTDTIFRAEQPVSISAIHPDCWGTPDAWLYNASVGLHIWDYKFGHGFVEVFENWQLIEYAAGILEELEINGLDDQNLFVNFYIVQPRSYHRDGSVRRWTVRASDLRPYFNTLRAAEEQATSPNARCIPTPECGYCSARHACEALQRSALQAVDLSTAATPWELDANSTGNELRYLKHAAELLDSRITGLSEQALAMIKRGDRVPHFKAEASKGRTVWNKPVEEVVALGEMMGVNLKKPTDVITPLQAIDKHVPKELVQSYSHAPLGAVKLVPDDGTDARKLFGGSK